VESFYHVRAPEPLEHAPQVSFLDGPDGAESFRSDVRAVLLEDDPALEAAQLGEGEESLEIHGALAERAEQPAVPRPVDAELAGAECPEHVPVDVLEVHVRQAVGARAGELKGVDPAHHAVAGVEAEPDELGIGHVEEGVDLGLALEVAGGVGVKGHAEPSGPAALGGPGEALDRALERPPHQRGAAELGGAAARPPALGRPGVGQDDRRARADRGEEVRRALEQWEVRLEPLLVGEVEQHEGAGELEAVAVEPGPDGARRVAEVSERTELDGAEAEPPDGVEHGVGWGQVAPADGQLGHAPGDGGAGEAQALGAVVALPPLETASAGHARTVPAPFSLCNNAVHIVRQRLSVNVLGKAGAVLDALAEGRELSARELAEATGEPRSSVYRLLGDLRRLEYVEPGSERGRYRLGMKLFRLGSAVVARFDERQAAIPVMEQIHEATGDTVFLAVRRGFEAVCIERLEGERVQSLALRIGGSLPLHAGGVSRALLAFEPEELWDEYVASAELVRFTDRTLTTPDALRADLRRVRRQGYAVSDQDVTVGIAAIGAPVFDHRGRVCAAVSISGLRPAILGDDEGRIRALAVEGARRISHALGSPLEPPALSPRPRTVPRGAAPPRRDRRRSRS
jgi:DNA-binding IclR family transcriptional regulator